MNATNEAARCCSIPCNCTVAESERRRETGAACECGPGCACGLCDCAK